MLFFEDFGGRIVLKLFQPLFKAFFRGLLAEFTDPKRRRRAFKALWAFSIVEMIVITAAFVGGFYAYGNPKPGLIIATILWAIFFGVTGLMFLSSKAIYTVFGLLLGTSVSEFGSSSGLISALNRAITEITGGIAVAMGNEATGKQDPFISMLVWIFVLIVIVLCLPAFFIEDKSEIQEEKADISNPADGK